MVGELESTVHSAILRPAVAEAGKVVAIPTQALYAALIVTSLLAVALLVLRTRRLREEAMLANDRAPGVRDLRGYALALLDTGRFEAAEDAARAFLDRMPGDAGFRALLGALAARRGARTDAASTLEHALRLLAPDGQRPPVQRQRLAAAVLTTLAGVVRADGRAADSERYLQMARTLTPEMPVETPAAALTVADVVRDDDIEQGVYERLDPWEDRAPAPRALGFGAARAARQFFRAATRRGQPSGRLLGDLALAEEAAGDAKKAERTLRKALQVSPGDAWLHHAQGEYLWRSGRLEESANAFTAALKHAPGHTATATACALVQMRLGKHEEAVALLRRAVAARPDISLLPVLLGRAALALGNATEAAQAFAHAEKLGANDARFHAEFGDLLARLGQAQAAEAQYRLALRSDGPRGFAGARYGTFLMGQQRYDEADSALQQALLAPGGEDASLSLARLDLMAGRMDALEQHLQAALGAGIQPAEARELQAQWLLATGKHEAAATVASRLIELGIRRASVYLVLGQASVLDGRAQEGQAALAEALRADPSLPDNKLREARALFENGYLQGASFAATQALALRPNWPDAVSGLEAIKREQMAHSAKRRAVAARPAI